MSFKFIQLPPLPLEAFLNSTDTSFNITGFIYNDGLTLVEPADIGDICYATIEPRTPREELISFTIDSINAAGVGTVTAVRGLSQKSPYGTGGATFEHQAGSTVVCSNNPGLFDKLAVKSNDEVITGTWTFNISPISNSATRATEAILGNSKLSVAPSTNLGAATITIATPSVVSNTAHGLIAADSVEFTTDGALPTGLLASTTYFVIATGLTANAFQLALTIGGDAINTSGTQSGVHTLFRTTAVSVGNDDPRVPTADEKAAMAGEGGTPSATNKYKLKSNTKTAGATIAGATLPVPVYQNKTDNEFYACDANDTDAMKYLGFAISDADDGEDIEVQFTGVVSGFTSLAEGEKYYAQDTVGTIGTAPGTNEVLVGIAISETELLIQKGRRIKNGNTNISAVTASGSEVITCGFRPSRIRVLGTVEYITGEYSYMDLTWSNSTLKAVSSGNDIVVGEARLYRGSAYLEFTITSVTDTGFTITYTENSSFSVDSGWYSWEAEGEI
tara:strand:+ start:12395 stop:13906 length:1512 start_codon:yes stop_codon:yes gene_type:complete